MSERFEGRAAEATAPIRRGFAITSSDETDLPAETRALYVGSPGDVAVVLSSGDEVVFASVAGGTLLPVRARRVKATGTSAAQILGLY